MVGSVGTQTPPEEGGGHTWGVRWGYGMLPPVGEGGAYMVGGSGGVRTGTGGVGEGWYGGSDEPVTSRMIVKCLSNSVAHGTCVAAVSGIGLTYRGPGWGVCNVYPR